MASAQVTPKCSGLHNNSCSLTVSVGQGPPHTGLVVWLSQAAVKVLARGFPRVLATWVPPLGDSQHGSWLPQSQQVKKASEK